MIDYLAKVTGRDVSRETFEKLESYVAFLVQANHRQNLISAATVGNIWVRHIFDSAQLVALTPEASWIDIGSGAGLPGMVTAILTGDETTLVEPRRLRMEFLAAVSAKLGLGRVTLVRGKPSKVSGQYGIITARAVTSATELLRMTLHLSHSDTIWLLPKGRSAQKELDEVRLSWQGDFRLEPSRTDEQSSILVAKCVRPWGKQ